MAMSPRVASMKNTRSEAEPCTEARIKKLEYADKNERIQRDRRFKRGMKNLNLEKIDSGCHRRFKNSLA